MIIALTEIGLMSFFITPHSFPTESYYYCVGGVGLLHCNDVSRSWVCYVVNEK